MKNKGERISSPTKDELSKPGPGAYDGNNNYVRERTPDFRFGTYTLGRGSGSVACLSKIAAGVSATYGLRPVIIS